jgi:hypothetical protein
MKLTVDILQDVVANLDGTVTTVAFDGPPVTDIYDRKIYKIIVDCPKWCCPSAIVSLQTHPNQTGIRADFCIIGVGSNYIEVRELTPGQDVPYVSVPSIGQIITFESPELFYRHGTVIDVNDELVKIDDSTDKFPMVYTYEPFNERFINDPESSLNRNSTLRLFLLGRFDREDWNTDDHYTQVIQAMNNLADVLIDYFINEKGFGVFDGHDRMNHVNLSVQRTLKGQETQIFDDYLSGTEIRLTLPITKSCVFLQCN